MRHALRRETHGAPDHPGLAYDVWAEYGSDGKYGPADPGQKSEREAGRQRWLDRIARTRPSADYTRAYARYRTSHLSKPLPAGCIGTLDSRLLIGHGNPSPVDIGLTLHHTWGVPVIPGSALKGLLSQYLEAVYGPADDAGDDEVRRGFRGPQWGGEKGNQIVEGPGQWHRALFGAPDVAKDEASPAAQGRVIFYDALFVPGSIELPLATDVLTVHQRRYYGQGEDGKGAGQSWPSDYDDPNPVPFLTVRPGARFLILLGGDTRWARFALRHLQEALIDWGIGGKTVAGYGRFENRWLNWHEPGETIGPEANKFRDWLHEKRPGVNKRQELERIRDEWYGVLAALDPDDRDVLLSEVRRYFHRRPERFGELFTDLIELLES